MFDKQADAFEMPFFAPNDKVATRSIINSQKNQPFLNENADDYELHCLGTYDKSTGIIQAEETPTKIYQLVKIKKEEPSNEH